MAEANEVPELGVDANVFQRLERLERHAFGRALHDPVEDNAEVNSNEVASSTTVGE